MLLLKMLPHAATGGLPNNGCFGIPEGMKLIAEPFIGHTFAAYIAYEDRGTQTLSWVVCCDCCQSLRMLAPSYIESNT
jgi:hypothetical protein